MINRFAENTSIAHPLLDDYFLSNKRFINAVAEGLANQEKTLSEISTTLKIALNSIGMPLPDYAIKNMSISLASLSTI